MDTKYVNGLEKADSEIRAIDFSCLRLWFGAVFKKGLYIHLALFEDMLLGKQGRFSILPEAETPAKQA